MGRMLSIAGAHIGVRMLGNRAVADTHHHGKSALHSRIALLRTLVIVIVKHLYYV